MTPFIKKKDIKKDWYLIDAQNIAVGRLAAYISKVLRGKNKASYNPHIDNGDFVVVTNIEKIKFSEKNSRIKNIIGTLVILAVLRNDSFIIKRKNKTEEILKLAVKRMLPGGPLAKKQLSKLKIYNGETHPHEMQKPKVINFEKFNKQNLVR